jgi:hypothetical protein
MAKVDRLGWAAGLAVTAYGHRIGIRVSEAGGLERMASCLPPGWKPLARPEVDCLYSLVVGRNAGRVKRFSLLYRGTEQLERSHDLDAVLRRLEDDLQLHVADAAPARVFVHAGVVAWRGRAVVLPGPSLAGKSTLVAALVDAGATYYSDEYAVIDAKGRVHPYARPIALRTRPGDPVRCLEVRAGTRPLPVGLVAFTRYRSGARWRSRALTPGQGLLALLEATVPVRRRPKAALTTLREVVTRAPVISGVRGEVEEAVEKLFEHIVESRGPSSSRSRGRRDGDEAA